MDDDVIQRFLAEIQQLPSESGASLDQVLKPTLEYESELRKVFASDRDNDKLKDPHVGLVDLFGERTPDAVRRSRARVVVSEDDEAFAAHYVMPLPVAKRRKEGEQCIVSTVDDFKKNWAVFTEGSLGQLLDWSNVVAAGGSVLSCLAPLSEQASKSRRNIRKWYHQEGFPTSDVDLFLWGLNAEQAEAKIKAIYEAVRDSIPWDVTCVRTKHTVSIHSQYPYRSVQIVLRLYQSPAEILAGFDIDAPCCAYDGTTVWANPRAIVATMRQCNTVDMSRRSPSYEVRLTKYASRGFEIYIPDLRRADIDPTIFERSVNSVQGMARLLVLEKLTDLDKRYAFLESRRTLRGRPAPIVNRRRQKRKYKGDLKGADILDGLEHNDYDVETLHIPYGPGWDAKRIDKLVYSTDLGMNSTFNPKNKKRRLHRHPAFFGTVEECIEDCCEMCPDPVDDDEKKLQSKEDEKYIRGRIQFIDDNPGRQSISGSFNPIDVGEWSDQVYIKPTQHLYSAIAAHDEESVRNLLKDLDVNQRDHVGRTPLHLAILCQAQAIACHLIDVDARITARLVDGRTPLHLAAQFDLKEVLVKLFERSAKNLAEEKKKDPTFGDKDGDEEMKDIQKKEKLSSEDDWSSHSDDDVEMVSASEAKDQEGEDEEDEEEKGKDGSGDDGEGGSDDDDANSVPERTPSPTDEPQGDIPEDEKDEPDVIDPNLLDWDFGFTPLAWAILYGSVQGIEILLSNGADINVPTKRSSHPYTSFHPLELTILRQDEGEACAIAECLIKGGVSCSTANKSMWTTFHRAVSEGRYKLVETFLRTDRKAVSSLDFPAVLYNDVVFPVATAVGRARYAALAILLSYDVKLVLDEADVSRAIEAAPDGHSALGHNIKNYLQPACLPVEAALGRQDDVIQLLLALGATINQGVKGSTGNYTSDTDRATFLDWVQENLKCLTKRITNLEKQKKALNAKAKAPPKKPTWKHFFEAHRRDVLRGQKETELKVAELEKNLLELRDATDYLQDAKRLMEARGAKGWKAVYPEETRYSLDGQELSDTNSDDGDDGTGQTNYAYVSKDWTRRPVPEHLKKAYDELYAACFSGDDKKVEKLCKEGLTGKGNSRAQPLKMAVYVHGEKDSTWGQSRGYTPLFAALAGKRWSTVKLILKIVAEQYQPAEKKDAKYNPKIRLSKDDSSSDEEADSDEDYDSEEGEETEREDSKKFYDVREHSASARSDVSPRRFLDVPVLWRKVKKSRNYTSGESPLIEIAIINNDFEAFVQLASLHESYSVVDGKGKVKGDEAGAGVARGGPKLSPSLFEAIVTHDCPEILDEFIRRTGYGIDVKVPDSSNVDGDGEKGCTSTSTNLLSNDENRLYLGLNVHGKKRKDLATANDPNAHLNADSQHNEIPLVWLAARSKSVGVLAYLGSEKPLEAYNKYALEKGGNETRAVLLRRFISAGGFDTALRGMLGWCVDELGQSPVFAAISGNDIRVLKEVAKMEPDLSKVALGRRLKFINFNMLILAVCLRCKHEVVDYLLEKGQDPTAVDSKGYNIYHHACKHEQTDLLAHLLSKLPREVSEQLLKQESKKLLDTPLHIAVRTGMKGLSQLIIDFFPETIQKRNVDGQTPLHVAASKGRASILSSLISSATGSLDVGRGGALIQEEDGVGNTILDIAMLHELEQRTTVYMSTVESLPDELSTSSPCTAKLRYGDKKEIETVEEELVRLKDALNLVKAREKAKRRTKVIWELGVFAGLLEKRIGDAKVKLEGEVGRVLRVCEDARKAKTAGDSDDEDAEEDGEESPKASTKDVDAVDHKTTLQAVLDALKQVQSGRQLVHVSQVQRSVRAGLENVQKTGNGDVGARYRHADDFDTEEDKDQKMKDKSMLPWIFNYEEVESIESTGVSYY